MRVPRLQPAFHADTLHCSRKCSTCSFTLFYLPIFLTHTHSLKHTYTDHWPDKGGSQFQFTFSFCSAQSDAFQWELLEHFSLNLDWTSEMSSHWYVLVKDTEWLEFIAVLSLWKWRGSFLILCVTVCVSGLILPWLCLTISYFKCTRFAVCSCRL